MTTTASMAVTAASSDSATAAFALPPPSEDAEILSIVRDETLPAPTPLATYYTQAEWLGQHQYIHFHLNGVAVIGLADTHPIVAGQLRVTGVSWPVLPSGETSVTIRGKRKKNAAQLEKQSVVCSLQCSDGSAHEVKASVRGKLLEVNESLATSPTLLVRDPQWRGYVCVIAMWKEQTIELMKNERPDEYRIVQPSRGELDTAAVAVVRPMESVTNITAASDAGAPASTAHNASEDTFMQ